MVNVVFFFVVTRKIRSDRPVVCSGTVLRKRKNQNLTFSRGQPVPRDAGRNTVQYDVPIACCTRTAHVCCRDRVETRTASRLGEFISATGGCATDRPGRDAHKLFRKNFSLAVWLPIARHVLSITRFIRVTRTLVL